MEPRKIKIAVSPAYPVFIGSGLLRRCGETAAALPGCRSAAVVTDTAVGPLYLPGVESSLRRTGLSVYSCVYPAGEAAKTLPNLSRILEFLAEHRLTRTDCVLALGGGVCGDMAGFAAGCYLRGISFIQLPTTLLAAVDSSVGGKTAVDLPQGKNLAGLFHQPAAVLCDTDCLQTLPEAELACGAAEAVKTGVLAGEGLFSLLENGFPPDWTEIIARCVACKGRIVESDPEDRGLRRTLNLGHTMGHAVERCGNFSVPHGQAVSAGLACAARAAEKLGWTEEPCAARIVSALTRCRLPVFPPFSAKELAAAALNDKKRSGDSLTLAIPVRIGKCVLKTIPVAGLEDFFSAGMEV